MAPLPRLLLTALIFVLLLFGAVRALGAETVAGTIKSIDQDKYVMVLTEDGGAEWTLRLAADVKIRPAERKSPILENLFSASPTVNAPDPVETLLAGYSLAPRVEYNYKLSDLCVGDRLTVTFANEGDDLVVAEIRLMRP
jgi:hypothetical protein